MLNLDLQQRKLESPTVTVDSFQPETKRSAKMLTGTPAELAKQLYDLIEEEKGK